MTSEFYFQLGEAASGTSERPAVVNDLDQRRVAAETAFEFAKKLGTLEAYRFFLQSYGDSTFADAAELAVAALEEEAKKSTNMDISIDSAFPGTTEHGGTACHWIVVPSILWKNSPVVIQEATIAELADELDRPLPTGQPRTDLMTFVGDRPRHDFRLLWIPQRLNGNSAGDRYGPSKQDYAKQLNGISLTGRRGFRFEGVTMVSAWARWRPGRAGS